MTHDYEREFFLLPVDVRLTIVAALQAAVAAPGPFVNADEAADVLLKIGFPESERAARDVAAGRL